MKFGLIPVNVGVENVEQMVGLAQLAESVGFESVWTFEHAIVPVDYESKYPYDPSGKMGAAPETPFVDPLIALAHVAAHTQTVKLATGVNILSQANALYLAKQAASLDFVSGGRFMLGVGIGWLREEFAALGVPFERRGARFADYVQAMRKVWSGDVVEHHSEFLSWSGFKSYPKPLQNPLPVIIGGVHGKTFERVARYGQGWYAPSRNVAELSTRLEQLDAACAAEGRDRSSVEVSAMWFPGADPVDAYEELGVNRLVVPLMALVAAAGGDPIEAVQKFGTEVLAKG